MTLRGKVPQKAIFKKIILNKTLVTLSTPEYCKFYIKKRNWAQKCFSGPVATVSKAVAREFARALFYEIQVLFPSNFQEILKSILCTN